jgi:predicted O-methyltransferase YrrM
MSEELLQKLLDKYRQYLENCDQCTVTSAAIEEIISMSRAYLSTLPTSENEAGIYFYSDRMRCMFRGGAISLLNKAPWLEDAARQMLYNFIEEQPEYFGGKYIFSSDWFTHNITQWKKDLQHLAGAPRLNFLEIGSFEGLSCCWLLENILTHDTSKIICIDSFDVEGQGSEFIKQYSSTRMSIEARFDSNIAAAKSQHKVQKIIGLSQYALRLLPLSYYDFIYIDGSHVALNVIEDAVLSWRLLKKGGLLTFDDYEWDKSPDPLARPKIAINAFLDIYNGYYKLVHKGYQVTVEKLYENRVSCTQPIDHDIPDYHIYLGPTSQTSAPPSFGHRPVAKGCIDLMDAPLRDL